ncbi:glycerate kinase type-2 family protein [Aestuariivirga sp.]|uniref:glycerate kinase type-2 family protein n=1 Tax=Aestuariivirga sp. TaxID=2650926 RepID=UPI0039E6DCF5
MTDPKTFLRALFDSAVDAALPEKSVPRFLPEKPKGRTIVIGTGKASAAMAKVFEEQWQGPLEGLIVTRYGHAVPTKHIRIVEAAHPVPDAAGEKGAAEMLQLVQGLTKDDLVVALMSGGGSALLSLAAEGVSAEDKRAVNRALLKSGAPIQEMNCVRKHLSRIKGGRLAAAAFPARVETLVISDVPGDDVSAVASGPTVPDPTTYAEARNILAKYNVTVPDSVRRHLEAAPDETPKPGDPRLAHARTQLIASPQTSLEAAAAVARKHGITPLILGDALEGEARDVGFVMAGIARQVQRFGQPVQRPCVLISGGETTVTVRGSGVGGRNVEFLLALAIKLAGAEGIHALAADTDGVDGAVDVAGAMITPDTLARARAHGIDPWESLANNDAHTFFKALGNQVVTGPTLTNVNDFRAVLVV